MQLIVQIRRIKDQDKTFNILTLDGTPDFVIVPIPADLHDRLFAPFTREVGRASQHGLGLGLYICSEIAKAYNGTLRFTSSGNETTFTFCMTSC